MKITRNFLQLAIVLSLSALALSCQSATAPQTEYLEPAISSVPSNVDVLEVVYFHRPQRCEGCVYAETGTKYTLETYFAEELKSGQIVFKAINLADEANAATVKHYGAYTSSLFIKSKKDGNENIEEVKEIWFLLGKDSEFVALVKSKIDRYFSGEIP
ncbi:nitrophenyl compound nitroreductase subunit ArsF family protein [Chloroflexota bacterium]